MGARIRRLTTVPAAALLLSACGGSPLDGKTGSEVAAAAADALEEAGAVHMAGEIVQDGEESSVDLHLQGEDAEGMLTFGGVELQLLTVDGTSYLQTAPEFWASFGRRRRSPRPSRTSGSSSRRTSPATSPTSPSPGSSTSSATRRARSRTRSPPRRSTARTPSSSGRRTAAS